MKVVRAAELDISVCNSPSSARALEKNGVICEGVEWFCMAMSCINR